MTKSPPRNRNRKGTVSFNTLAQFLEEEGLSEHFDSLKKHSMDLDLLHDATSMELTQFVGLPLGDAKQIVAALEHASKKHQEAECSMFLVAESNAMDSRTLVATLIVGASATLVASASPTELPKNSEVAYSHEVLFALILTAAFLSMCFSMYGILTLEFFGDYAVRIEAHVNVVVAAMWLKSKEKWVIRGERSTHWALLFLIIAAVLMTAQKLAARSSRASVELIVGITMLILLPIFAITIHIPCSHKPGKNITDEMDFEVQQTAREFQDEIEEQISEHHEVVEHDLVDHERHREDFKLHHCGDEALGQLRTKRVSSKLRHVRLSSGRVRVKTIDRAVAGLSIPEEGQEEEEGGSGAGATPTSSKTVPVPPPLHSQRHAAMGTMTNPMSTSSESLESRKQVSL